MRKSTMLAGLALTALTISAAIFSVPRYRAGSDAAPSGTEAGELGDLYINHLTRAFYVKTNGPLQAGGFSAEWTFPAGVSVTGTASVTGTLDTDGLILSVVGKTAAYTNSTSDYAVLGNIAAGAYTTTLPAAASNKGRVYSFVKTSSGGDIWTIDGNASETINGAANLTITNQWNSVQLLSDGTNFVVIAEHRT